MEKRNEPVVKKRNASTQTEQQQEERIVKKRCGNFTPDHVTLLREIPEVQKMIRDKKAESVVLRAVLADERFKILTDTYTFQQLRDRVRTFYR